MGRKTIGVGVRPAASERGWNPAGLTQLASALTPQPRKRGTLALPRYQQRSICYRPPVASDAGRERIPS